MTQPPAPAVSGDGPSPILIRRRRRLEAPVSPEDVTTMPPSLTQRHFDGGLLHSQPCTMTITESRPATAPAYRRQRAITGKHTFPFFSLIRSDGDDVTTTRPSFAQRQQGSSLALAY